MLGVTVEDDLSLGIQDKQGSLADQASRQQPKHPLGIQQINQAAIAAKIKIAAVEHHHIGNGIGDLARILHALPEEEPDFGHQRSARLRKQGVQPFPARLAVHSQVRMEHFIARPINAFRGDGQNIGFK